MWQRQESWKFFTIQPKQLSERNGELTEPNQPETESGHVEMAGKENGVIVVGTGSTEQDERTEVQVQDDSDTDTSSSKWNLKLRAHQGAMTLDFGHPLFRIKCEITGLKWVYQQFSIVMKTYSLHTQ